MKKYYLHLLLVKNAYQLNRLPSFFCWIIEANAAVNLTVSIGVNESPGLPPIVPRIPEIDLISVMRFEFDGK